MTGQLLLLDQSAPPRRPARQVTAVQATQLAGHALRVLRRLEPSPQTRDTVLSWADTLMVEGRLRPCPHPLRRSSRYGVEDLQTELDLWTDDEIIDLHEFLLDHSLHTLGDGRASQASVADVWAWLGAAPTAATPAVFFSPVLPAGRAEPRRTARAPDRSGAAEPNPLRRDRGSPDTHLNHGALNLILQPLPGRYLPSLSGGRMPPLIYSGGTE